MSRVGVVWRLRWRLAGARRRLFLWNVVIPLGLLAPVAISPAAAPHRAAVYAVLVVLFGTFGACIPLVRDGRAGWTEALLLTGYMPSAWLTERVLAETCLDAAQLIPALAVLAVVQGTGPGALAGLGAGVALALLTANLLGVAVAATVRSVAEGALGCAAVALLGLHLAGVFRPPLVDTWQQGAARWSPFRPLHEALAGLGRPAADGLAASADWLSPLLATGVLLLLLAGLAPLLGRRLAVSKRGD